jgi:hypothetical protein
LKKCLRRPESNRKANVPSGHFFAKFCGLVGSLFQIRELLAEFPLGGSGHAATAGGSAWLKLERRVAFPALQVPF